MERVTKPWKQLAAREKEERRSKILDDWILTADYSIFSNLLDIPINSGILSEKRILITMLLILLRG